MNEDQIPELAQPALQQGRSLKEQFTTVTPLSKFLAMLLFGALPFIGFAVGLQYSGKALTDNEIVPSATRTPVSEVNSLIINDEESDVQTSPRLSETESFSLIDLYYGDNKKLVTFKTIMVRGKLACSANAAILMSWPNPYGDPLQYLELYTTHNDMISWIYCDDPWYVNRVASGDDMVTVKGVIVPRFYGDEFPDPYAPDSEPDINKHHGIDFFIVDRSY